MFKLNLHRRPKQIEEAGPPILSLSSVVPTFALG